MAPGANPERWQKLDRVFQQALDLPASERDAYLREACGEDGAFRADIDRLLADYDRAGEFLETPAFVEWHEAGPPEPAAGTRLGHYRLIREIGRGGMGTVFEAVRDDGAFDQRVAVKLIRKGLDTEDTIDRFRRERQILARVNHPHIARLFDGGASPDGRPFFVMELIEGRTLMEHCRERKTSLEERLRLFLQICGAVSHAHQNLIIHRDLKPANVVVTQPPAGQPQVKLLDFGIAKVLDSSAADRTLTRAHGNLLTPDYASPEQVRGDPVTTAVDVYALGLILFELLTGERAQRATGGSLGDIERAVCDTQPARPSEVAPNGVVHSPSRLRGDLDNIVLKALQKDPSRRYQSVTQFSEDIERFLSGRPVMARPDSVGYRLGKFVQRNRWAVAACAAILAAIAGGVWSTLRQARIAREHFNSVRSLSKSLMTEIDSSVIAVQGATKTRQLIVQRSIEYLDKLAATAGGDRELLVELADAYKQIGSIQGNRNRSNIGDYKGSMVSFRKSIELRWRAEAIESSPRNLIEVPLTASEAARVFPGTAESAELAALSVRVAEEVERRKPGSGALALANAHFTKGYLHCLLEEPEPAIAEMEKTRELFAAMKRPRNNLAVCDRYIAMMLQIQGRFQEAADRIRQARALDEAHVRETPTPRARMDQSYDEARMAFLLLDQGRHKEAMAAAEAAGKIRQELAAADPSDRRIQVALTEVDHLRGRALTLAGDYREGARLLEKARDAVAASAAKDPESLEDRVALAQVLAGLATNYRLSGRCAEADALVESGRAALGSDPLPATRKRFDSVPPCARK